MSVGEERRPLIPKGNQGWLRMLSLSQGVAFLPVLLVIWSSAAFIISYVIAVLYGHVQPVFPYISDTGATPPESGIFGFMINVSAFLGAATMYIRYLITKQQNEITNFMKRRYNVIVLGVGLVGCIGMSIVASFQELAVPSVHDGGALVAFIFGVLYITFQTIISFKSCPQWSSHFTCWIRLAISSVSWVAVTLMIAFASMISITKIDWNPGEKDYNYHLVSAICEWTVAFGFVFFFLTFIKDFQVGMRNGWLPIQSKGLGAKLLLTKNV
ncbi:hypothetical protein lerEdw1_018171 [Lerista edwardsae]|nr:hypothetical protein lerEdw1_018171 [Lerista edwardsae]